MKTITLILIFALNQYFLLGQEQKLKKYESCIESRSYEPDWIRKYHFKNGLTDKYQDIHYKQGLINELLYTYDDNGNIIQEQHLRNVGTENEWKFEIKYQLTYDGKHLVESIDNFGWITHYSDFNLSGKPQLIKTYGKEKKFYTIEQISYDKNGNKSLSIKEKFYSDTSRVNEVEIIKYEYDYLNNIIEIRRNYKPEKKFPVIMIGGLNLYKVEIFRYVYNDDNLWTKKSLYLDKDGKELASWTREYK